MASKVHRHLSVSEAEEKSAENPHHFWSEQRQSPAGEAVALARRVRGTPAIKVGPEAFKQRPLESALPLRLQVQGGQPRLLLLIRPARYGDRVGRGGTFFFVYPAMPLSK